MIIADFFRGPDNLLKGFRITGHAGMADHGHDVCCASVSSAVMMTANTVTEAFKIKAAVSVEENEIMLKLPSDENGEGDRVLLGLLTHLYFLSDEFSGRIKVRVNSV
ncbi:MAG: ribosomal-processing cysteine protease Prp [Ruminococcus sp.]|nr:ribosomal-processing cysteine protease Prp [Ruminococcus sp.]